MWRVEGMCMHACPSVDKWWRETARSIGNAALYLVVARVAGVDQQSLLLISKYSIIDD
jgi:hypothetical protein